MNSLDIRKFVTGFLILSALASSSAILIANFGSSETQKPSAAETKKAEPQAPTRAFVEQLPSKTSGEDTRDSRGVSAPSGNLTQDFSRTIAEQIARANPSGPDRGPDGQMSATAPDETAILAALQGTLNDPQMLARVVREVPNDDGPLETPTIINSPSSADIVGYVRSLNAIMDAGNASGTTRADRPDPQEALNAVNVILEERVFAMKKLSVPAPLLSFHRAALSLFEKAHKMTGLALGVSAGSDDPLKQLLLVQIYSNRIDEALRIYGDEAEKAQAILKKVAIHRDSLLSDLFGVRTAHANFVTDLLKAPFAGAATCWLSLQLAPEAAGAAAAVGGVVGGVAATLGGFVPVNDSVLAGLVSTGNYTQTLVNAVPATSSFTECMKKFLTDALKDKLVHKIVEQTIHWIQGGGTPQFVQDWRQFLTDTADITAGAAIQDIVPGLCSSFGLLLRYQLEATYLSNPPPITCTLDQVVSNVKNFYVDFSQGGWDAYGAAILPSGNYFGQLFEATQIIEARRQSQQQATQGETLASGGFHPTKMCVKPISPYERCLRWQQNVIAGGGEPADLEVCAKESKKQTECEANGWVATTPGVAIASQLNNALGAPLQRIINAQDLANLITALIDTAFDQLTKLVDGKPNDKGVLGIKLSSTSSIDQCLKLSGDAQLRCLEKIGGGTPPTSQLPPEDSAENCNGGKATPCNCRERDHLTDASFCFLGNVNDAVHAVVAAWEADPSFLVGLVHGSNGAGCNDPICVRDAGQFKAAVARELRTHGFSVNAAGGGVAGETEVTGICTTGGPVCGQAGCVGSPGSPRTENYAFVSSDGRIRGYNIARAVCSVSQ